MLRRKLGGNKIYLVLDNWSVHRSKKFKAYIKQDGGIEVFYLPKMPHTLIWWNASSVIYSEIFYRTAPFSRYWNVEMQYAHMLRISTKAKNQKVVLIENSENILVYFIRNDT